MKLSPVQLNELFPTGGTFSNTTQEFLDLNISKSLVYPPNREWNKEYFINRKKLKDIYRMIKDKCKRIDDKTNLVHALD
jgi:hypothetical protein